MILLLEGGQNDKKNNEHGISFYIFNRILRM